MSWQSPDKLKHVIRAVFNVNKTAMLALHVYKTWLKYTQDRHENEAKHANTFITIFFFRSFDAWSNASTEHFIHAPAHAHVPECTYFVGINAQISRNYNLGGPDCDYV